MMIAKYEKTNEKVENDKESCIIIMVYIHVWRRYNDGIIQKALEKID